MTAAGVHITARVPQFSAKGDLFSKSAPEPRRMRLQKQGRPHMKTAGALPGDLLADRPSIIEDVGNTPLRGAVREILSFRFCWSIKKRAISLGSSIASSTAP